MTDHPGFAALMIDVDGVVVPHPEGGRWDPKLLEDLGVDPVEFDAAFFTPPPFGNTSGRGTSGTP